MHVDIEKVTMINTCSNHHYKSARGQAQSIGTRCLSWAGQHRNLVYNRAA